MQRINFTLDDETIQLLGSMADQFYGGNKSMAIRAAVESLAAHSGHAGWIINGFVPVTIDSVKICHCCDTEYDSGSTLFRPVFCRGVSPHALEALPNNDWLDCERCTLNHLEGPR